MEIKSSLEETKNVSGVSAYLLTLLAFLFPVFFVPLLPSDLQFGKMALLSLLVLLSVIAVSIHTLRRGEIELPREPVFLAAGILPLVYLLSAFFSDSVKMSVFGYGFELDTFFAVAVLFLLFLSAALSFETKEKLLSVYLSFFSSFVAVLLFQLVRLFLGPDFLSFGVFTSNLSNVIGKWTDFGAFLGLGVILSLISLEFLSLNKTFRAFLYAVFALSLFFLSVVNFQIVWILLGIFSFVLFAYQFSFGSAFSAGRKASGPTLLVVVISLAFILSGNFIGNYVSEVFKTENIEARPSWASTTKIAKESIKENPLLGAGPNRFSEIWRRSKPPEINNTAFWNSDFYFGASFVGTVPVNTGILGALAWLLFFAAFLFAGWRVLISPKNDKLYSYLNLSSFLASAYLFIIALVYTPSLLILALAFLFAGVFVSGAMQTDSIRKVSINLSANPKTGFVAVFLLMFVVFASFAGIYVEARAFAAHLLYQKGIFTLNQTGDIQKSEKYLNLSSQFFETDVYLRGASEISVMKLQNLLNDGGKDAAEAKTELQLLISDAVAKAKKAIDTNPSEYGNWLSLGRVYEFLAGIKVTGAYEEAAKAYEKAGELNPKSPAAELILAKLDASVGNFNSAKEHISKALLIKNNYTDAIFLLSQIEVSQGKVSEAISSVETAALIAPNDPGVFFQLGLLKYGSKDYRGAIGALERAVELNPSYSNAKYFLGLGYHKVGRTEEAITQFEDIIRLNPGNSEVALILENLKAGQEPFRSARPPVDENPEKRENLPIEE